MFPQVLKWIRNNPDFASTPVVVFWSSTRDYDRAKAREFLSKPKSGLEFGAVVDELREKWLFSHPDLVSACHRKLLMNLLPNIRWES